MDSYTTVRVRRQSSHWPTVYRVKKTGHVGLGLLVVDRRLHHIARAMPRTTPAEGFHPVPFPHGGIGKRDDKVTDKHDAASQYEAGQRVMSRTLHYHYCTKGEAFAVFALGVRADKACGTHDSTTKLSCTDAQTKGLPSLDHKS